MTGFTLAELVMVCGAVGAIMFALGAMCSAACLYAINGHWTRRPGTAGGLWLIAAVVVVVTSVVIAAEYGLVLMGVH